LYHDRVIITSALVVILNLFFIIYLARLFSARAGRKKLAFAIYLGLGVLVLVAFVFIKFILIFFNLFLLLFYFILFTNRLSGRQKFWISTAVLYFIAVYSIPYAFPIFMDTDQTIVALHFFNFFFALPFSKLSELPGFSSEYFAGTIKEYISSQALFTLRYASGILIIASMGVSYQLLKLIERYIPVRCIPGLEDFRLPAWFLLPSCAALALFLHTPGGEFGLELVQFVWPFFPALLSLQGLGLLHASIKHYRYSLVVVFVVFFMLIFSKTTLFVFAIAGTVDILMGLRKMLVHAGESVEIHPSIPRAGAGAQAVYVLAVIFIAAFAVLLSVSSFSGSDGAVVMPIVWPVPENAVYDFTDMGDRIVITGQERTFSIDKYEYPDIEGEIPVTGVDVDEARRMCTEAGKRLCTPAEWETACQAGSLKYYYYRMTEETELREKLLDEDCGRRPWVGVTPSGKYPKCSNPYNVHDMFGNVWELVSLREGSGYVGIMGQGGDSDQGTFDECTWIAVIFENQYDLLPNDKIGFRCCGGEPPPDADSK